MSKPILFNEETLIEVIAQVMCYGGNHFDDEWREKSKSSFELAMEAVSMTVACLLAQHTVHGNEGVEWEVVHKELCQAKWTHNLDHFRPIARENVKLFGGAKHGKE